MLYCSQKIELVPNDDQIVKFYGNCGYAKFAYNFALSDFKDGLSKDV